MKEALIYYAGQEYWTLMQRYRQNKENPLMRPVTLRELGDLRIKTRGKAITKRINVAINQLVKETPPTKPRVA